MPVKLIPQDKVEGQLKTRKCSKIKAYSHGSGSLWVTHRGYYFIVPKEPEGHTDENTLQAILAEIHGR